MTEKIIQNKRIRENAPHRKSMSMSDEDLNRATELEELFSNLYPEERPFTFSKTISKALEIASNSLIKPEPVQKQALKPAEPDKSRVPKMFRNGRKH